MKNRVAISDNYFSKSNIELDNTVVTMVPTRGAVVKAEFVTHVGYRVLFRVLNANGKPVPFGAIAAIQDASLGRFKELSVTVANFIFLVYQ